MYNLLIHTWLAISVRQLLLDLFALLEIPFRSAAGDYIRNVWLMLEDLH